MIKLKKISCAVTAFMIGFSLMVNPAFADESSDLLLRDGGFVISDECEMFGERVLSVSNYGLDDKLTIQKFEGEDVCFHAADSVSEEQIKKILDECAEYYNIELLYSHDSNKYNMQTDKLIINKKTVEKIMRMICQKLKFAGLISDFVYKPYCYVSQECEDTLINYSSDQYDILTKYVEEQEMNCKVTKHFQTPPESDKIDSYCSISSGNEMSLYERVKQAQQIYADTGCKPLEGDVDVYFAYIMGNDLPIDMYNEETDDVPGVSFGDIDNNQSVDINDLVILSQFLLHDKEPSYSQSLCADVKYDKSVDIIDLATLKQYIMKDKIKLGYQRENNQDIVFINITHTDDPEYRTYGEFYDKLGNKYEVSIPDTSKYGPSDRRIIKEVEHVYRTYSGDAPNSFSEDDMESMISLFSQSIINNYDENRIRMLCFSSNFTALYGVKYDDEGNAELISIKTQIGSYGVEYDCENGDQIYDIYSKGLKN